MVSDHLIVNAGLSSDPKKHSGILNLSAVLEDLRAFSAIAGLAAVGDDDLHRGVLNDVSTHASDERIAQRDRSERRIRELTQIVDSSQFRSIA